MPLQQTASLKSFLLPRNPRLNDDKGEALLSFSGKGAYGAARDAHAGLWSGYPPRLVVKYLGARLQSNGSLHTEISKRIASARAGFAKFAQLFKCSLLPQTHKVLVFKAVVNEALLSALEVRPLTRIDEQTLEKARGMLLRRLFGRQGYGAVANDPTHTSVTIESLRQRANLSTIASELLVRRLMWLRGALLAERSGQVRLELAALFGTSLQLQPPLRLDTSAPSAHAPRFLHILFRDIQYVLPEFRGFSEGWRDRFLQVPVATIRGQASWRTADSERNLNLDDQPEPANDPAPAHEGIPELALVANIIRCPDCGAGPWQSTRALKTHQVRKHNFCNPIQATVCQICGRQFTSKSVARRHVQNNSCYRPVNNHGHAGAIEGQRIARAKAAAQAQAASQVPPRVEAPQRTIAHFFINRNAAGLSSAAGLQPREQTAEENENPRVSTNNSTERQVQELTQQLRKVCQIIGSHDRSLRELEAWSTHTWLFHKESEVAKLLADHMEQWKQNLPQKGQPHPQGPARLTVAAAFAKWLLQDPDRKQAMPKFATLHEPMSALEDLHQSIQLAFIKPVRDGRTLLKIRPQLSAVEAWKEAAEWIQKSATELKVECKDLAPPGPLVRSLMVQESTE